VEALRRLFWPSGCVDVLTQHTGYVCAPAGVGIGCPADVNGRTPRSCRTSRSSRCPRMEGHRCRKRLGPDRLDGHHDHDAGDRTSGKAMPRRSTAMSRASGQRVSRWHSSEPVTRTATEVVEDGMQGQSSSGSSSGSRSMLDAALEYLREGFRPIPVKKGTKRARIKWAEFQDRDPTEAGGPRLVGRVARRQRRDPHRKVLRRDRPDGQGRPVGERTRRVHRG
jgi:hypothetical protein